MKKLKLLNRRMRSDRPVGVLTHGLELRRCIRPGDLVEEQMEQYMG